MKTFGKMVIRIGQRIPQSFFVAQGHGESDLAVHAGSFHMALRDAGIEMFNIMEYSSILPEGCREVPPPKNKVHGAVLECIMSKVTVGRGETGCAGIGYGFLRGPTGLLHGGLVVERTGGPEDIHDRCVESLRELWRNGYDEYELSMVRVLASSVTPKLAHGTALVALCFVDYLLGVGVGDDAV